MNISSKDDQLTVGVIMAKGQGAATKEYLRDFVARLGLADRPVLRDSGHLTRCRTAGSPLRQGRIMVAGDAAGLLEPWTREGISYALRSGTWAGEIAAKSDLAGEGAAKSDLAGHGAKDDLAGYEDRVTADLVPEMDAGRRMLRIFAKRPGLVHAAMATPLGWRAFQAFCRGELSMADVIQRRGIHTAVTLLGGS